MFNAENDTIQGLINAMLLIIPAGAAARVISCGLTMMHEDEEQGKYKRRMKNAVIFTAIAECAVAIVNLAYHYYS